MRELYEAYDAGQCYDAHLRPVRPRRRPRWFDTPKHCSASSNESKLMPLMDACPPVKVEWIYALTIIFPAVHYSDHIYGKATRIDR